MPHVHLVEPVPLGGELGYYSGEDMPEKASMMAYSDVFLTVYSTMVVETAMHDRPIISVCIDVPGGWNTPGKFSLSLSEIGEWPTHQRFRAAGAGRVTFNQAELQQALDFYLRDPQADGRSGANSSATNAPSRMGQPGAGRVSFCSGCSKRAGIRGGRARAGNGFPPAGPENKLPARRSRGG